MQNISKTNQIQSSPLPPPTLTKPACSTEPTHKRKAKAKAADGSADASPPRAVCHFFATDSCKFGNKCRDSHEPRLVYKHLKAIVCHDMAKTGACAALAGTCARNKGHAPEVIDAFKRADAAYRATRPLKPAKAITRTSVSTLDRDAAARVSALSLAGSHGTRAAVSVRRVVTETVVRAPRPPPAARSIKVPKQVVFLIDESGSMMGSRFRDAVAGVRAVFEKLHDGDWVALYLFSSSMREVVPVGKVWSKKTAAGNRTAMTAALDALDRSGPSGGGTRLYGSMQEVCAKFKPPEVRPGKPFHVQYELVVLTDGGDSTGASVAPLHAELLRLRASTLKNLHVELLAVDLNPSTRETMGRAVADGVGAVIDVSAASGAIKDTFERIVQTGIQQRATIIRRTVETVEIRR